MSAAEVEDSGKALTAVLANPTLSPESRSAGRVRLAAQILGFDRVRIANLFAVASSSSKDIAVLGQDAHGWELARPDLKVAVSECDQVLLGFGTIPVTGAARLHLEHQLEWLEGELTVNGHEQVWQVGEARHPSRWHQYVSDRHGRTSGGSFEERLQEVLVRSDLSVLQQASARRRDQRA